MAQRNVGHVLEPYLKYFKFPDQLVGSFKVTCITCGRNITCNERAKTSNAKTHLVSELIYI